MKLKPMAMLAFVIIAPSLLATGVAPMNLADLTYRSPTIFEGRCVKVEQTTVTGVDGEFQIPTVRYTFEVVDALKGESGQTLVINQLGRRPAGEPPFPIDPDWVGLPEYETGETYLLFMAPVGPTGMRSPMGTSQGSFVVAGDKIELMSKDGSYLFFGLEKILSSAPYRAILDGIRAKGGGKVPLDKALFKSLVRDMLAGKVSAPTLAEVVR